LKLFLEGRMWIWEEDRRDESNQGTL
jgi:hypothetical protein